MKHSKDFKQIVEDAKKKIPEISCGELYSFLNIKEIVIIDVREDDEWETGHLPHAIHVSKGVLERDIHKQNIKKEAQIVLYCSGGYRSLLAGESLQRMGYSNISSLEKGFKEWLSLKLPVSF